jgi:hypothetical protein
VHRCPVPAYRRGAASLVRGWTLRHF